MNFDSKMKSGIARIPPLQTNLTNQKEEINGITVEGRV
jgi:hypothetical protein